MILGGGRINTITKCNEEKARFLFPQLALPNGQELPVPRAPKPQSTGESFRLMFRFLLRNYPTGTSHPIHKRYNHSGAPSFSEIRSANYLIQQRYLLLLHRDQQVCLWSNKSSRKTKGISHPSIEESNVVEAEQNNMRLDAYLHHLKVSSSSS